MQSLEKDEQRERDRDTRHVEQELDEEEDKLRNRTRQGDENKKPSREEGEEGEEGQKQEEQQHMTEEEKDKRWKDMRKITLERAKKSAAKKQDKDKRYRAEVHPPAHGGSASANTGKKTPARNVNGRNTGGAASTAAKRHPTPTTKSPSRKGIYVCL